MSEIKFSCPQCQQHISCDEESYGGTEIACPTCGGKMIVPRSAAPPPPRQSHVPAPPPAPGGARLQSRPGPARPEPGAATRSTSFRHATTTRSPAAGSAAWWKSPYPYLGVLAAGFGVLYYFGRQNDLALALFVLAALLYIFVVHIIVVIHAFKNEGVGMGIGALCLLPFTVFYVFFKSESPTLKMFYGLAILLKMGVWTVKPMLESLK